MREVGSEEEDEEEEEGVVVEDAWREEGAAFEWWRDIAKVEDGLGPVYFTRSSRDK